MITSERVPSDLLRKIIGTRIHQDLTTLSIWKLQHYSFHIFSNEYSHALYQENVFYSEKYILDLQRANLWNKILQFLNYLIYTELEEMRKYSILNITEKWSGWKKFIVINYLSVWIRLVIIPPVTPFWLVMQRSMPDLEASGSITQDEHDDQSQKQSQDDERWVVNVEHLSNVTFLPLKL